MSDQPVFSPTFSIVIFTRNRHDSLERCLQSLVELESPPGGFEIVVADDGSTPSYEEVVARFRAQFREGAVIRHVRQEWSGIGATKNLGVRHARGEYVAIVADDFTFPADYLTSARRFFESHPDARVLTHNVHTIGRGLFTPVHSLYFQLTLWQNLESTASREFFRGVRLPVSRAAIVRRSTFDEFGPFTESYDGGEDYDYSLRLGKHGIPVYFSRRTAIRHHCGGSLRFYLRQRVRYAKNYVAITVRNSPELGKRFPLNEVLRRPFRQWLAWLGVARRFDALPRFVLYSPGIFLFLSAYWLGVYVSPGNRPAEFARLREAGAV